MIDSNGQWAYPSAGATAVGVTLEGSSSQGDVINVAALNGAQLEVEADAALATLGTLIASSADGQAAAATTGQVVLGHLGSTSGAADEIVSVVTVSGSAAP